MFVHVILMSKPGFDDSSYCSSILSDDWYHEVLLAGPSPSSNSSRALQSYWKRHQRSSGNTRLALLMITLICFFFHWSLIINYWYQNFTSISFSGITVDETTEKAMSLQIRHKISNFWYIFGRCNGITVAAHRGGNSRVWMALPCCDAAADGYERRSRSNELHWS